MTQNRWNVPSERPDISPEETYGARTKKNTRCEQRTNYRNGSQPNLHAYDIHCCAMSTKRSQMRNS